VDEQSRDRRADGVAVLCTLTDAPKGEILRNSHNDPTLGT
jgi:hypothetical protein